MAVPDLLTALYGAAAILLAQSRWFLLALVAALLLGALDAMATTIRHAAVQVDTPDDIRGRVTAFYQMCPARRSRLIDVVGVGRAGRPAQVYLVRSSARVSCARMWSGRCRTSNLV